MPQKLLRIISPVLERGSTVLRGAAGGIFHTTHGVKQGCPMPCFLFLLVFEIPLRYLSLHNICFSAYVDDITTPAPRNQSSKTATIVQHALSLIGCQLNVLKSESLPMVTPPPSRACPSTYTLCHLCRSQQNLYGKRYPRCLRHLGARRSPAQSPARHALCIWVTHTPPPAQNLGSLPGGATGTEGTTR